VYEFLITTLSTSNFISSGIFPENTELTIIALLE